MFGQHEFDVYRQTHNVQMCTFSNKCHKNTDKGAIHSMFMEGKKEGSQGGVGWEGEHVIMDKVTPVILKLLAQR